MSRIIAPQWVNRRRRGSGRPRDEAQRLRRAWVEPDSIDGCVLWLKADSLTLSDDDPVVEWRDDSGQDNDVEQTTSADQPTFKTGIVNGKPVVRFNGSSHILSADTPVVSAFPFEVFGVYEGGDGSGCALGIIDRSESDVYQYLGAGDTTGTQEARITHRNAGTPENIVGGGDIDGTFRIVNGRWVATNDRRLRVGGTQVATSNTDTDGSSNWSHTDIGAFLRSNSSFTHGFGGDIAELIVYSRDLSIREREQIEGYLNDKYSLF